MVKTGIIGALALALTAFVSSSSLAADRDSAQVTVSVEIGSVVEIDFPQGRDFLLSVPSFGRNSATTIPFTVRTNSPVAVSARPHLYLQLPNGRFVGRADRVFGGARPATGGGRRVPASELGYELVLEFPVASPAGHRFFRRGRAFGGSAASLDGAYGGSAGPVAAGARHGSLAGAIHILPAPQSAAKREPAAGQYAGAIDITVTTENASSGVPPQ